MLVSEESTLFMTGLMFIYK